MNFLAFDTSSSACSVALRCGDKIHTSHQIAPMQQARLILPMIQELLDSTSLKLEQLDAIIYGCGPGSFTGIRMASSVAQGLAFAAQKPVISVSSLAAIAQSAHMEKKWTNLLVALDARMDKIYWAAYAINQQGLVELQGQERLCAPEAAEFTTNGEWYGVGDAWDKYAPQIGYTPLAIHSAQLPTAAAVLALGMPKFEHNDWLIPSDALPVYLR